MSKLYCQNWFLFEAIFDDFWTKFCTESNIFTGYNLIRIQGIFSIKIYSPYLGLRGICSSINEPRWLPLGIFLKWEVFGSSMNSSSYEHHTGCQFFNGYCISVVTRNRARWSDKFCVWQIPAQSTREIFLIPEIKLSVKTWHPV